MEKNNCEKINQGHDLFTKMFPAGSRLNDHNNFKHIYTARTIRRQAHFIGKNTQTWQGFEDRVWGRSTLSTRYFSAILVGSFCKYLILQGRIVDFGAKMGNVGIQRQNSPNNLIIVPG